jgi:transcriptional regulator with XRE-family HTH domain
MTPNDIRRNLREMCELAGGQADVARKVGVSQQFLSAVLNGRAAPGSRVLGFLGLERIVIYRPIAAAKRGRKG